MAALHVIFSKENKQFVLIPEGNSHGSQQKSLLDLDETKIGLIPKMHKHKMLPF